MRTRGLSTVPLVPPPAPKPQSVFAWLFPDPAAFVRTVMASVAAGLIIRSIVIHRSRRAAA